MVTIRVKAKFSGSVSRARLKRIAERALRAEDAQASVAIYIADDAEIRRLNRSYHGTNAPTDVLSFPMEGRFVEQGRLLKRPYMGDIVISYETARKQARAAGWRIADELDLLAVHGILHLLGYDDLKPRAREKMWRRQEEILDKRIP